MTVELDSVASPAALKYLRLQCAKYVGPVCTRKLIEHFGAVEKVLSSSTAALEEVEGVSRYQAQAIQTARYTEDVQRAVELAAAGGARIICREDEEYPKILTHTADPPVCLYVRGRLLPDDGLAMAIVGSRRNSHYGIEQSHRFGELFAQAGFTVVSGLARGADGAAHRGALSVGGRTVAVLGCGLGHIYPQEHAELAEEIVDNGALVSELPMDVGPDAKNFPPRNRIVVGMSLGVLVTECAKRSGALISARLASEYNREVFALPGLINNPLAYGTNALIRDGQAKLVMSLEDVLDELGDVGKLMQPESQDVPSDDNSTDDKPGPPSLPLNAAEQAIISAIQHDDTTLDHICDHSSLTPATVAATLTKLQMTGLVIQKPGNLFSKRIR